MTVNELIKKLEKLDPNECIGLTYRDGYGTWFHSDVEIEEIFIDINNRLEDDYSSPPFTKVFEIS